MHFKENVFVKMCLLIFFDPKVSTVNFFVFLLLKFCKIWQTGSKYFTLLVSCFSLKSTSIVFCRSDYKERKTTVTIIPTYFFFVFKNCILLNAMCLGILEDFTEDSTKSQIKPCLGISNSRPKPKILTEMIVKPHLIITDCM